MSASEVASIRLVSIGKRYAGTSALDDVSLEIRAGSVHALVGANGAGKSTLGKVIGGVVRPDDGEMFVNGRAVKYATPRDARNDGIATIAQELALCPRDERDGERLPGHRAAAAHGVDPPAPDAQALRRADRAQRLRVARRYQRRVVAHRGPAEGRDPPRRQQRRQRHRHGRADLVADERGDRGAAQDDAVPARPGQDDRLREPLPRRGARARRHGDRASQRPPRAHRAGGRRDRGEPCRRHVRRSRPTPSSSRSRPPPRPR